MMNMLRNEEKRHTHKPFQPIQCYTSIYMYRKHGREENNKIREYEALSSLHNRVSNSI